MFTYGWMREVESKCKVIVNSYGVFYWGVIKCSKIDNADGHTTLKILKY